MDTAYTIGCMALLGFFGRATFMHSLATAEFNSKLFTLMEQPVEIFDQ